MTLIWDRNKRTNIALFILSIFIFFLAHKSNVSQTKPVIDLARQDTVINFNEDLIKAISFGQYRLLSSALWSETLLKADLTHFKGEPYKNWMFLRLKLITTLDPYFYSAYLFGGIYLSIIKDDDIGAEYIYDNALKYYPEDLYINLNSSYHYYYEVGKTDKAIASLRRTLKHPNVPSHVPRLLARMSASKGDLIDAKLMIEELYKSAPKGSPISKKHYEQLTSIQIELDLECLNKNDPTENCNKLAPNGKAYYKSGDKWTSPMDWEKFRIKKRKAPPKKRGSQKKN